MQGLYHRLPAFLQPPALSVAALWKARRKYGQRYREHLAFLLASRAEERAERADRELRAFLDRVRATHPAYEVPVDLDLRAMPVLSKDDVRRDHARLARERPWAVVRSSGTTGAPLAVPCNRDAYQKEYAFWWYHRAACGLQRGVRVASMAGHPVVHVDRRDPPYWVFNAAENQLFLSSYHIAPDTLDAYVKRLNRFSPLLLHGYPSSLYLLARWIVEREAALEFRPRMIVASSETTLDFQRRAIERAFDCKLHVWYGNTELCGHITECPRGRLHVQPYHSHVRLLGDGDEDVAPGEEGRIVATNFTNTAFPLINYDTRDVARLSRDQDCGCAGGGTLVDYVLGRIEDYVITPEGRHVGRLDHLFKSTAHVRNAQLEQDADGTLIIRVEREPGYGPADESAIEAEARARLGRRIALCFDYVDEIPRGGNGKFRFVIQRSEARFP